MKPSWPQNLTKPTPINWHHKRQGRRAKSGKEIQTVKTILAKRAGCTGFSAMGNRYKTIQEILLHLRGIEGFQNHGVQLGDEIFSRS